MTRKIGPLLPGVVKIPFPSPWEKYPNETEDQFSDRMFEQFKLPFETYLPADETALIEIEAIQGDGGFCKVPEKYMNKVFQFAKDHGILFAVDEVNQGLGRSGKMWSIYHFPNVEPDLIAVGKSLASGLPLSAVIGRAEIIDALSAPGNVYTTAGNPISAAAANATLNVIENENLVKRSHDLGIKASTFFHKLQNEFPFIGDVRIYGLNGGIDIINPKTNQPDSTIASLLISRMFELGLLMITVRGNILRFQPPLVINDSELIRGYDIIEKVMLEFQDEKIKITEDMERIGW